MPEKKVSATPAAEAEQPGAYSIIKQDKSRWWEVRDPAGELVCLTVYRRGAREVVRRLSA
jgi:hypothetical protein